MDSSGYRPVLPITRLGLGLGVVLTFLAGTTLFVLARDTDRYFAWTIAVPMTAAFIGVFYYMATVVAVLSYRRDEWAMARVGIPGVLVFLWVTCFTTLRHHDQFHFGEGPAIGQVVAWAWLVIYLVDPILLTLAFVLQVRLPGTDRPGVAPMTPWYRTAVALVGAGSAAIGVALAVAPGWVDGWWPWPVTALTGRMMAAWLLGSGIVLVTMAWDGDLDRVRPAAAGLIPYGVLQAVVLLRFSDDITRSGGSWFFVVSAVVAIVLGAAGLQQGRRSPAPADP